MARVSPIFKSPLVRKPVSNGVASYLPPSNRKPKVVSVPVIFVESETNSAKNIYSSIAAIKIQRVFRGFLVRKNAKIVRGIEAEVDEIEKKFAADREMDLIVGDPKERIKINEMLMKLLFRLDSARGVRDYRKRVIQRVILIQEMLDSISAVESDWNQLDGELKNKTLEAGQSKNPDPEDSEQMVEPKEETEVDAQTGEAETIETKPDQNAEMKTLEHALKAEYLKPYNEDQNLTGWELIETNDVNDVPPVNQESDIVEEEENKKMTMKELENVTSKNVTERMVAENEKLKVLVAELCQRSAQQCRLMGGLAERVECLEKVVQKMEKKKKKKRKENAILPTSNVDKKGSNHTS